LGFRRRFPDGILMGRQHGLFLTGGFFGRGLRFRFRLGFWFRFGLRLRFGLRFRFGRRGWWRRFRLAGSPFGYRFQYYRGAAPIGQFQRRRGAPGQVYDASFGGGDTAGDSHKGLLAVPGIGYPYFGSQGQAGMAGGEFRTVVFL
jgi:hypothetical protein